MSKLNTMLEWLRSGKCDFPKLKLRFYSEDNRGVCARRKIYVRLIVVPGLNSSLEQGGNPSCPEVSSDHARDGKGD